MRSLASFAVGLALVTACGCSSAPTSSPEASINATAGTSPTPPVATVTASYARAQPAPLAIGPAAGSISGGLGYPSEYLPPQATYAVSTDGRRFYRVQSVAWQQHYTILGVASGDYFVLTAVVAAGHQEVATGARTGSVPQRFGSGYTRAVLCGLSVECTDHSLIPVHVASGVETKNINPGDWYADPGTYPFMPSGEPPASNIPVPPTTFDSLEAAAKYWAQAKTGAQYVSGRVSCPVNTACVWLASFRLGVDAAYYLGSAGSNDDIQACALYFVRGKSWQLLGMRCSGFAQLVAVAATARVYLGIGEQGCVNIHSAPAISARVVACVAEGTLVQIDDGPNYYASSGSPSSLDVWWHLASRGWMVDHYLGAIF